MVHNNSNREKTRPLRSLDSSFAS